MTRSQGLSELVVAAAPASALGSQAADPQSLGNIIHELRDSDKENSERLVDAINEQSVSLKTMFETLTKAVEALKPQPQSTDKRTAFWTAYKTLADEFDKEIQGKHGDDLDTALIFAGLFSAVTSAFIIQIQPELQVDPNAKTQALLGLLVQNMTGVAVPSALLPDSTGPARIILIAQSILYFSLFSTLLAALLAVLGKQWLLYYDSVAERGTTEERGLERQRKFDGMRRWKFDLVMQIFPLLLQFSLLLFATALSVYLLTIHHGLAGVVLGLTCLGFVFYAAMIVSAVAWTDSPFQTSLAFLLRNILDKLHTPEFPLPFGRSWNTIHATLREFWSACHYAWSASILAMKSVAPLLPLIDHPTSRKHLLTERIQIFGPPPPPSKEISAILWALETSTDPIMVEKAAAMVPRLQWGSVKFDAAPLLKRLADILQSCLNPQLDLRTIDNWQASEIIWLHQSDVLLEGMSDRAMACFRAFGVLAMVAERPVRSSFDLWAFERRVILGDDDHLDGDIWDFSPRFMDAFLGHRMILWNLRFIAAQAPGEEYLDRVLNRFDPYLLPQHLVNNLFLGDFLFCLHSFLSPTLPQDHSLLDKSGHLELLTGLLFENLARRLTDNPPLNNKIIIEILNQVFRFMETGRIFYDVSSRSVNAACRLCATPGLPREAITCTLRLVRVGIHRLRDLWIDDQNVGWVYQVLEDCGQSFDQLELFVGDLLQVLFLSRGFRPKPTTTALRVIISALSPAGDVPDYSGDRLRYLAAGVLCAANHWFQDSVLGPILMEHSIWPSLAIPTLPEYLILGDELSRTPGWARIISQDPSGWLMQYPSIMDSYPASDNLERFRSVLSRVWEVDAAEANRFDDEKTLAMVFMMLVHVWDRAELSNVQTNLKLLESTIESAFSVRIIKWRMVPQPPSQHFGDTIMLRLADAITGAAERAKQEIGNEPVLGPDSYEAVNDTAKILKRLASMINGELRNPETDYISEYEEAAHWVTLRNGLYADVATLHQYMDRNTSSSALDDGRIIVDTNSGEAA